MHRGGQDTCTEHRCAGKGGKYGVHVCSSNYVMDKQGQDLAEAAARKRQGSLFLCGRQQGPVGCLIHPQILAM